MNDYRYTPLLEVNDHEGEAWTWWVQVEGNQQALDDLAALIERANTESEYGFEEYDLVCWPTGETLTGTEVDLLVEWSTGGYYDSHNRVDGVLVWPEYLNDPDDVYEALNDALYKGGIDRWERA